jgi:curved DNA-binding protein CbpA
MKDNLYEILNLEPEATLYEIKKQFRKLSVKYHPDKIDKNLTENEKNKLLKLYEKITYAFDILSNEKTRREYDQMYYIEKRNETYDTLKGNFKDYTAPTPDKTYKEYEATLIKERHKKLTETFKERTLAEYMNERDSQMNNVVFDRNEFKNTKEKQIIQKLEPQALLSGSIHNCQDLDNLGELYSNDLPDFNNFTIDNIDTNIVEKSIDEQLANYKRNTDIFKSLKDTEFNKDGDLITDKIIIPS